MKPSEERRYTLYARRRIRLFEDAPTSNKGWKDRYFFVKREGLCDPVGTLESGIHSAWTERASNLSERLRITAEQKNVIRTLLRTKTKSLLSILSEDSFRSTRYWPALEEATSSKSRKNFEEEDPSTQQSEEIPEGIPLPILEVPYLHVLEGCIRLLYGVPTNPLWASYPATDMGKLKMKISKAELEATKKKKRDKQAAAKGGAFSQTDKGEERPTSTLYHPFGLIDGLPDRGFSHDSPRQEGNDPRVGLEAEQNALKLAQNARYLYDAVIKVDKEFKKKAEAYINAVAANKTLEENSLALKQTAMEATKRAEQLERKWSEANQKLIEKDRELEALRLNYAQVAGERDALQARVTPDPSDEEEDGQEDMEITSGEDELDDGDVPLVNQPEAPRLNAEPNQATSNDSSRRL
ncbi:hypothetical protein FNV43_RR13030 [Rhamnella rubrinervis]|uniref:Uncharacterized protein n=1 Tax=Rhamnella rubrinervis TaxID=2594499 RepID=A0A8K0MER2_9ROSA|nr:hypothetical protein FNV43_RR13030 [Rhamnella rubrinervis]